MIGKRLTELRKSLKLNQEEFAKLLGLKRPAIASIETDRNPLTESNIKLICFVFRVNEEWLRDGNGEMFKANETPLEQEVTELFRLLSPKAQVMIRDYIRMVLDQQQALQGSPPAPEQPETPVSSIKPADTALKKRSEGGTDG